MPEPGELAPLLTVLRHLTAWLQAEQVRGVVIGGVAASLWGRPRLTRDVDALAFARETRVLLVRHGESGIDLDLVFGSLPFEKEAAIRAKWVDLGGVAIPLSSPEDLIVMKAVAHRPRDLEDIAAILAAQPELNVRRVRRWLRAFSGALAMPEILNDLEALLSQRRKRPRPVPR